MCFPGFISRLKGLPYLIGNHIAFLLPACELHILPLGKEELCIRCMRVTGIGGYQLTTVCLFRIHTIGGAV